MGELNTEDWAVLLGQAGVARKGEVPLETAQQRGRNRNQKKSMYVIVLAFLLSCLYCSDKLEVNRPKLTSYF